MREPAVSEHDHAEDMTAELQRLYLAWREAADQRSAVGNLRPEREEVTRFDAYVQALERSSERERREWEERRAAFERQARCRCGHPLPHHDREGRCFHIVGCATVCDCSRAHD